MEYNFFEIDIHKKGEERRNAEFAKVFIANSAKEAWEKMAHLCKCAVSRAKVEYYIDNSTKTYKVEVEDDNFEIVYAVNPMKATEEVLRYHEVVLEVCLYKEY